MFTLSSASAAHQQRISNAISSASATPSATQSVTQEIFANVASQKLTAFRATELLLMFATEIEYSIVQLGQEAAA